jgi:tripartite-type tricarboxylate transporter receptor subunit TctC
VTEHMSRTLRQQMVIENIGGAGGTLGSARVAAAQSDGYTLLAWEHGISCRRARTHTERQVRF